MVGFPTLSLSARLALSHAKRRLLRKHFRTQRHESNQADNAIPHRGFFPWFCGKLRSKIRSKIHAAVSTRKVPPSLADPTPSSTRRHRRTKKPDVGPTRLQSQLRFFVPGAHSFACSACLYMPLRACNSLRIARAALRAFLPARGPRAHLYE